MTRGNKPHWKHPINEMLKPTKYHLWILRRPIIVPFFLEGKNIFAVHGSLFD
ncbi:MAG: hypothetical protein JW840_03665 [Candidatus Thermoplasmatota archaeon]|nr:hypothetical protein [Candidatus Thermoplasmatota archaeon]